LPAAHGEQQTATPHVGTDGEPVNVFPQWAKIRVSGPTRKVFLDVFGNHVGQKRRG
jgi:hypothetical protein